MRLDACWDFLSLIEYDETRGTHFIDMQSQQIPDLFYNSGIGSHILIGFYTQQKFDINIDKNEFAPNKYS